MKMKYAFCVILVLSALNPLWGIRTLESMAEGRAYNEKSGRVLNKLLTVTYKEDAKGI